jgi:hypothetical protein
METEAIESVVETPIDTTVVALTPAEMPAAQQSLLDWCDRKVAALEAEAKDLEEHRAIATANGWKLTAVARQLSLSRRRIEYYGKIKAAVSAGYLIVPNMPVDVFAVRVQRSNPPDMTHEGWNRNMSADPQVLPSGEGRYVSSALVTRKESWDEPNKDGKMVTKSHWRSESYDDVDFPVKAVKPIILDATSRAMGLRIFDQLGIVRDSGVRRSWGRKGDPIVVGQLIDPRSQGRGVTFFVAWWLDTATL